MSERFTSFRHLIWPEDLAGRLRALGVLLIGVLWVLAAFAVHPDADVDTGSAFIDWIVIFVLIGGGVVALGFALTTLALTGIVMVLLTAMVGLWLLRVWRIYSEMQGEFDEYGYRFEVEDGWKVYPATSMGPERAMIGEIDRWWKGSAKVFAWATCDDEVVFCDRHGNALSARLEARARKDLRGVSHNLPRRVRSEIYTVDENGRSVLSDAYLGQLSQNLEATESSGT